jgi:hypothetical protein
MLLRKPHGYGIIVGPEGTKEFDTLRCCHCQRVSAVIPGSGNRRGWCFQCGDATCGALACQPCDFFLKKIERQEAREKALRSILGG